MIESFAYPSPEEQDPQLKTQNVLYPNLDDDDTPKTAALKLELSDLKKKVDTQKAASTFNVGKDPPSCKFSLKTKDDLDEWEAECKKYLSLYRREFDEAKICYQIEQSIKISEIKRD